MKYLRPLIICMLATANLAAVQITSIGQLDSLAEFSFTAMGDNNGYAARNYDEFGDTKAIGMSRLEQWTRTHDEFVIGVGDHLQGTRKYWVWMTESDSFYHNNYYPVLGDNGNETDYVHGVTADQATWGRGWVMFQALNNFFNRNTAIDQIEFRQPGSTPIQSSKSKGEPNVMVNYPDQLCEYYARRTQGAFTFHILGMNVPDPGVLTPRSKDWMMNKLNEIAAFKTDYDVLIVSAQKARWVSRAVSSGWMSASERDTLMTVADLVLCGDDHIYRRQNDFDGIYGQSSAIWMNSGQPCSTTGSGRGYLNFHMFDNPPRFTVQYIMTDPATRELHVNARQIGSLQKSLPAADTKPYLKYINGDFESVNWNNFVVGPPPANNSQFVSQNVPVQMDAGETANVSITMKNTGADTWTVANGQRIGSQSPQDNTTWTPAPRVALSQNVASGATHTFNFQITAPSTYGIYDFQWKMLDESGDNTGWFGAATPKLEIIVGPEPIKIEAENFTLNSGFQTQTTSDEGGGQNISHVAIGDFAEYNINLSEAGAYNAIFRVASHSAGAKFELRNGSTVLATIDEPATGDWQAWANSNPYTVSLPAGNTTLTVFATGAGWNMNWFMFQPVQNSAPIISSSPNIFVDTDVVYNYTISATDPEGESITYSANDLPSWLSLDGGSRLLSGTPGVSDAGSHDVSLRASDGVVNTDQNFTIYVSSPGNDAPIISSTAESSVVENQVYNYTVTAIDPDGDTLSYTAVNKPSWLSFSGNVLSGTPTSADTGLHAIKIRVSDAALSVDQDFNVYVFETPQPTNLVLNPSFENGGSNPSFWTPGNAAVGSTEEAKTGGSSLKMSAGSSATKQVVALQANTDYNISVWINASQMTTGNAVFDTQDVFDGAGQGQFVMYNANSGWTQYSGSFNSGAETSLTLRMFSSGMSGSVYFDDIVVAPADAANAAPVIISNEITSVNEGALYTYQLIAVDAEGSALTYDAPTKPSWLSFDDVTGILSGTPQTGDAGDYAVMLVVSDGENQDSQSFSITVNATSTAVEVWMAENEVTDLNADDDGDGVKNLMEFALAGNPKSVDSDQKSPSITPNGSAIDFTFNRAENDITYIIESSTDLQNWTVEATNPGIVGNEVTVPVVSAGKIFIRLKVED